MKKTLPNIKSNISIELKEKWAVILSKVELPSTRMLLSQQAELVNIDSNSIEIGLSKNWENMIKSRKVLIETALEKTFGHSMNINFSTKKDNAIDSKSSIESEKNKNQANIAASPSKEVNKSEKNYPKESGSKNLANFFNGEVIDIDESD